MTPDTALKEYGHKLTHFERKEVREYEDVWFLGLDSKKTEGVEGASQNSGNLDLSLSLSLSLLLLALSLLSCDHVAVASCVQVMMMKMAVISKSYTITLPTATR